MKVNILLTISFEMNVALEVDDEDFVIVQYLNIVTLEMNNVALRFGG